MWSSISSAVRISTLLIVLHNSEASLLTNPGFFPPSSFKEFGKVLTLGGSSEEDENFLGIGRLRFSPTKMSPRIIRFGPECTTKSQRLDRITKECYKVGTKGPCGPLMTFSGNEYLYPEDNIYGHCKCDPDRYDRPMVSIRGRCHFLYSQAICDPGHFLVMDSTKYGLKPACRLNPCAETGLHVAGEMVPFDGHCVKLNAPSILCPLKDDVVTFRKGNLDPVCTTPLTSIRFRRQITKTNDLRCPQGYGKAKAGSTRCYRLLKIH